MESVAKKSFPTPIVPRWADNKEDSRYLEQMQIIPAKIATDGTKRRGKVVLPRILYLSQCVNERKLGKTLKLIEVMKVHESREKNTCYILRAYFVL